MTSYAENPGYVGTKPTWGADYYTDYYSVVALAVSRLPSKADEARHALYERARTTLKERLHSHDRPVSAAGLKTAQFRLEAAIRRVEMELVFRDMPSDAKEEATPSPPSLGLPPSLSFISELEEFVRSAADKLISYITMMRDRLRSSEATKLVPTKADITARLAQALEFGQKTQLKAMDTARHIYLSVFRYKS
ncbi:MAG: hypothetical protein WA728_37760 [Xanthobacteraceae bacterium]